MPNGTFKFEDCLLKHFIRKEVWLQVCRQRRNAIIASYGRKAARRMKYFTFCAIGALDVLLLDREGIVKQSKQKEFDTVFFFHKTIEDVIETRKRIPGAVGFPGDFFEVMLSKDPTVGLASPANSQNTKAVRHRQIAQAQRDSFVDAFPFDVLNLDVERYIYQPREELPGKLIAALREIFVLQTAAGKVDEHEYILDEFTLLLTTQVGPRTMAEDHIVYLRDNCLQDNLNRYSELQEIFLTKSGGRNVTDFFEEDFDGAFKLSVPKSLVDLAVECDWVVNAESGVRIFEFQRDSRDGPYCMLHLAMTVRRQNPPRQRRAPRQPLAPADEAEHRRVVNRLFSDEVISVETQVVGKLKGELEADLGRLFEHRRRYYQNSDDIAAIGEIKQ